MARAGLDKAAVGLLDQGLAEVEHLVVGTGLAEAALIGGDADHGAERERREAELRLTGDHALKPGA